MKSNNNSRKTVSKSKALGGLFDLEKLEADIASNEEAMLAPDFWSDHERAERLVRLNKQLKDKCQTLYDLTEELENLEALAELVEEEPAEKDLAEELDQRLKKLAERLQHYETQMLLSDEYDEMDAFLEIHPGAGGTESQDWASMLLRMYERFCARHGFKVEFIDYQAGEEAGLKTVSLKVKGPDAYGLLKSEQGIHRLVRLSPFDTNNRRHTSFASVEVMPAIDQQENIEINEDDIQMDVFRASGAGGQHVNKTNSAVRLTHIPTGTVAASQSQRSQIHNRETAMQILKAKLAQLLREKNAQELEEIRGEKSEIAWGSQIRSYVFHPYHLVKDHRTNYEIADVDRVMDGEIDDFIDAYLKDQLDD